MNRYNVTVTKAGKLFAEVITEGSDALVAIWKAEEMVKAKKVAVSMGDEMVRWSGLCFEARRMEVA